MERLMSFGNKNRSTGETLMNARSSRSHSIFSITVEASETDEQGTNHIRAGKLHLVDLAGSERQSKTGATGERFKEATKINLSLSALGNVISSLVDGKSSHIPYRDSKLTRLLQDSLGGNSNTLMVATISPASYNFEETLSTLRYANRAKNIKNKPKINEDPKDAMLRQMQEEIKRLKEELEHQGDSQVIVKEVEEIHEIEEIEEVEEEELDSDPRDPSITRQPRKHSESHLDQNLSPEDKAKYQRLKNDIEQEKQRLLQKKDLKESEKKAILVETEKRLEELDKEKKRKFELSTKLAQLEQKLLVGGVNLLDKDQEQQLLLAQKAQELEEKAQKERELQRMLEEKEEANLQIEEEFSSLQEEALSKTKKLKTMWNVLMRYKAEISDVIQEQQREREDALYAIKALTKELNYRHLVLDSFISPQEQLLIEEFSEYDETAEKWRIAHIAHAGNNIRGKRSLLSGNPTKGLKRDHPKKEYSSEKQDEWTPLSALENVYLHYQVKNQRASPTKRKDKTKNKSNNDHLLQQELNPPQQDKNATPKARGLVARSIRYV